MKLNAWALRLHPVDDPSTPFDLLCDAETTLDHPDAAENIDARPGDLLLSSLANHPSTVRSLVLRPYPDLLRPHPTLDPFRDCALARPLAEQFAELLDALHNGGAPEVAFWRLETWDPLRDHGAPPEAPTEYAHMVIHRLGVKDAGWVFRPRGRELHLAGDMWPVEDGELFVVDVVEECPALLPPVPA